MARLVVEGTEWNDLATQLEAWFAPGKKIDLQIGLQHDLSEAQLWQIQDRLISEGVQLLAPVDIGTGAWDNTLRLQFQIPKGYAVAPLLVVGIIVSVGAVIIGTILGWRIGEMIKSYAPYLIVGGLIFGIAWVAYGAKK